MDLREIGSYIRTGLNGLERGLNIGFGIVGINKLSDPFTRKYE